MSIVAGCMIVLGLGFILAGAVGILRLPDFYCRLHAMGKCDMLGVALMLGGLAVVEGATLTSLKLLLVVLFLTMANPTATHALGRAAVHAGLEPWRSGKGRS